MDSDRNQPLITEEQNKKQQYPSLVQSQPNPYNNVVGQPPNQNNNPVNAPAPPPPQLQPGQYAIPVQFQNHPQIVIIQQQFNLPCVMCGFNSGSYVRKTAGCAAFSWCVCLFILTGIFCFWVPFCIPSCMDTEIVCARCGYIKGIIQAGCL